MYDPSSVEDDQSLQRTPLNGSDRRLQGRNRRTLVGNALPSSYGSREGHVRTLSNWDHLEMEGIRLVLGSRCAGSEGILDRRANGRGDLSLGEATAAD